MDACIAAVFLLAQALPAIAFDSWTAVPHLATKANLWSVAYGDRTLVAVGDAGTILTYKYDDGVWLQRESGSADWLVGVGYGNGRFVVVGDRGTILTSDDGGLSWQPRVSGTHLRLNAVAFGDGRWLAVGEQGSALGSNDGITWNSRPPLGSGFLRALAWGRGRFLIGGPAGALFTTTDTVSFTRIPITTNADIEGVAISPDHFWAVGSNGLLAKAAALDAWTISPINIKATFRGVSVRNTHEASAVGEFAGATAAYRPDGQPHWIGAWQPPDFLATAVTQGLNELIAVGFGGNIARSDMPSPAFTIAEPGSRVIFGTDVRIRVISGRAPLAYQWLHGETPIAGATHSELLLPSVSGVDAGLYGVRFTTPTGITSLGGWRLEVVPGGRPEVRDFTPGAALSTVPSVVVPQHDGRVLVAGSFDTNSPDKIHGIARLNADGSLDASFRPGEGLPQGTTISDIQVGGDGAIYIRGTFTSVGGHPRPGLARLHGSGAVDSGFGPAVSFPTNMAPAPGRRLYVQTGIRATSTVARLAADGTRDAAFPSLAGVELLGADSQGRMLGAKFLTSSEGQVLRFTPEGIMDPTYTPTRIVSYQGVTVGQNDIYETMLTESGLYIVSSLFSRIGSTFRFRRLQPNGGLDPDYQEPLPLNLASSPRGSFAYGADGSLVIVRASDSGTRFAPELYSPNGAPRRDWYAALPDLHLFIVEALQSDGSLFGSIPGSGAMPTRFVRVRPLAGAAGRLTNLSVRSFMRSSDDPLIVGFVTTGFGTTRAIVRAVGPSLSVFEVEEPLVNPELSLYHDGSLATSASRWEVSLGDRFAAVGAFPLLPLSNDAALEWQIGAGSYTSVVTSAALGESGTVLAELYDSTGNEVAMRRFSNISARGEVTHRPLIAGFTISGNLPTTVLVRAAGPALAAHGVANVLENPKLAIYRSDGTQIWDNDDWSAFEPNAVARASGLVGAFGFSPGSKDAAAVLTLAPGGYTAVATSASENHGTALIEVYEVP